MFCLQGLSSSQSTTEGRDAVLDTACAGDDVTSTSAHASDDVTAPGRSSFVTLAEFAALTQRLQEAESQLYAQTHR